jgi:hypothetical protein
VRPSAMSRAFVACAMDTGSHRRVGSTTVAAVIHPGEAR